jgi:farnesyl-diphosphate farnesyltransferase
MASPSLNDLLKQTSRSFYLTLRVLPRAIRPQIGLAYLLARTTDTIADTEIVPVSQRLEALQHLRARILGTDTAALNFGALAQQQGLPAERQLLERIEEALLGLRRLAEADLKLVRQVLNIITSGQELDLQRFNGATSGQIIALHNDAELDDYTYRVAGCVGEFWTAMCLAHLFPAPKMDAGSGSFADNGVRFGKGLQLVNILRDLPADLQKGRCYLPADQLATVGLRPLDLLSPQNEAAFRPLYRRYLDRAESHLAAGWHYTNAIPFRRMNLRLACAWPILIGLKTIERLRVENVLDATRRVKVTRAEVRQIILRSVWTYPLPGTWRKQASFTTTQAA